MSILLESELLKVNLKNILRKPDANQQSSETPDVAKDSPESLDKTKIDWGEELKKRLADNKKLSADAQVTEYEIESKFFQEFFEANWGAETADQLMSLGEPLRKTFRVLGFKKNLNPIYKFLTLEYVIKNLLQTKLLKASNFKALYNAVANKWVADSEFFKANDYNVIYCCDLYKKSREEMEKYLELQGSTYLKPSANTYTLENRENNKKTLFYYPKIKELDIAKRASLIKKLPSDIKLPSAKSPSTQLNDYNLAKKIAGYEHGRLDGDGKVKNSHMGGRNQTAFANKFKQVSHIFAALQFLYMTTGNTDARKALSNERFSGLSAEELKKATAFVAPLLPKGQMLDSEVTSLVQMLLGQLTKIS